MKPPVAPRKQLAAAKKAKRASRKGGGDRLALRAQAIIRLREIPPPSTAKMVKLRLSREAEIRLAKRATRELQGWARREPLMPVGCDAQGQRRPGRVVKAARSESVRTLKLKNGDRGPWVPR